MDDVELDRWLSEHDLPDRFRDTAACAIAPLARRIAAERRGRTAPLVVGLCGSQGSGKSTFADLLARMLEAEALSVAVLSLDDLYLTREARAAMARELHPLFATRGPPGTHDVALGLSVLDALGRPGAVALPRFDKATDTRADDASWPVAQAPVDVVLFEGWCVGAGPQAVAELARPVNALEREDDVDGHWRRAVNERLAGDYTALFARIELLVLLQAPGFDRVLAWRRLQEDKLTARMEREGRTGHTLSDAALERFVMHYERLTRAILKELPARADVIVRLGPDHEVLATRGL